MGEQIKNCHNLLNNVYGDCENAAQESRTDGRQSRAGAGKRQRVALRGQRSRAVCDGMACGVRSEDRARHRGKRQARASYPPTRGQCL